MIFKINVFINLKQQNIKGSNIYFTSSHLGKFTKQKTLYKDTHFYHLITDT